MAKSNHRSPKKQSIIGTMSADSLITIISMGIGADEELQRRGWSQVSIREEAEKLKSAAEERRK